MSIKEQPPQPEDTNPVHVPVLLEATIDQLQPQLGEAYLDLTAGYGGHASRFLEVTKDYQDSALVDRDINAIDWLEPLAQKGVWLIHQDFVSAARQLIDQGRRFDIILADLGVSSPQLDRAERGFSFRHGGPLDMRMDARQELTAAFVVNSYKEADITRLVRDYGEENLGRARRIARAIIEGRPFASTRQLAETIEQTLGRGGLRQHPATRTFQALRIEVNQELKLIEQLMPLLPKLLNHGGRVGVISFHSLEDRIVKRYFAEQAGSGYEAELVVSHKKPILGTEDAHNPRSRSAKFRSAVKK